VYPNFVEDFDKALSKYCVFDLFPAIKHIKQRKFEAGAKLERGCGGV
jgi:hypothetical protein